MTLAMTPDALEAGPVDAALRVLATSGLASFSLGAVAAEAGCSRATLYRRYPGRSALLGAVVASESARLRDGLDAALAPVTSLPEALMAAARFGSRELTGHAALGFVLADDPGAVLPHACFAGGDRLLGALAGVVAPHLGRFLAAPEAWRAAEWAARIVLSYALSPPDAVDDAVTATTDAVRAFVVPRFEEDDRRGP